MHLPPTLLTLILFTTSTSALFDNQQKVLLSKVKALTLHSGHETAHRRVDAVPQLSCQGRACKHYNVETMRCLNQGSDYGPEEIQWSCTADIPPYFKLGSTEVICEGYDSPSDPYILKGSCGVEYRLLLTEAGEAKYGHISPGIGGSGGNNAWFAELLFWCLFIAVVVFILWGITRALREREDNREPRVVRRLGGNGGGGGGGWDGGGGGNDDPPPPYTPSTNDNNNKNKYGSTGTSNAWRPGFWSGLGLGAVGAGTSYVAGRRSANNGTTTSSPTPSSSSTSDWGSRRRSSTPSFSSSPPATHSSTGFGSTSRR